VNDRETAEKLKARIETWRSYIGQPARKKTAGAAPEDPARAIVLTRGGANSSNGAGTNGYDAAGNGQAQEHIESVLARCEAQIADLQATVDHEREQTRRLAETLARDKTLHTMRTQPPIDVYPPEQARPSIYRRPQPHTPIPHAHYAERRPHVVVWTVTILLILVAGGLFVFVALR
jgi:hypothetical protein